MLNNLRDLGGIKTADGKIIKNGFFVRSAALNNITSEEMDYIYSNLGVSRIIDLRTNFEVERQPDMPVPHVAYIHFPLQRQEEQGRNDFVKASRTLRTAKTQEERYEAVPHMGEIYSALLTSDFSRTNLRALISTLVGYTLGSTLYHCSSGKDRTGVITAIILTCLGVSREEIYKDYMASLPAASIEAERFRQIALNNGGDDTLAQMIYDMFIVKEEFLDAFFKEYDCQFDSDDSFIYGFLRMDERLVKWFRNRVLE